MTQSEFLYDYQVTNRRGINYFIGVRADPDLNQVESFAAIRFFRREDGIIEVCKVDDSPHEGADDIHVDRYYREEGAVIEDFDTAIGRWHDAEDYLRENAVDFVARYYDNHGSEPRDDEKNI